MVKKIYDILKEILYVLHEIRDALQDRKIKPKKIADEADYTQARVVLDYFNSICGKSYKSKTYLQKINARLAEGFTIDNCKAVINTKHIEWVNDPEMSKYLTPETLFRASKFEKYLQGTVTNTPDCQKCNNTGARMTVGGFQSSCDCAWAQRH